MHKQLTLWADDAFGVDPTQRETTLAATELKTAAAPPARSPAVPVSSGTQPEVA